jgi:hypothetical protein
MVERKKRLAAQAAKMEWQEFVLPGDGRKAKAVALKTKALFMECLRVGDDSTGANIYEGLRSFARHVGSIDTAERCLKRLERLMLLWREPSKYGAHTRKTWKHGTIKRQATLLFRDIPAQVRVILTDDKATVVEGNAEFDAAIQKLSVNSTDSPEVNSADSEVSSANSRDEESQLRKLAGSTPHLDAEQPPVLDQPVKNHHPSINQQIDGLTDAFYSVAGRTLNLNAEQREYLERNAAILPADVLKRAVEKFAGDSHDWTKVRQPGQLLCKRLNDYIRQVQADDFQVAVNSGYVPQEVLDEERARSLETAHMTEEDFAVEVEGLTLEEFAATPRGQKYYAKRAQ